MIPILFKVVNILILTNNITLWASFFISCSKSDVQSNDTKMISNDVTEKNTEHPSKNSELFGDKFDVTAKISSLSIQDPEICIVRNDSTLFKNVKIIISLFFQFLEKNFSQKYQTKNDEFDKLIDNIVFIQNPTSTHEKNLKIFIDMCFAKFNEECSMTHQCYMKCFVKIITFLNSKYENYRDEDNRALFDRIFQTEFTVTVRNENKEPVIKKFTDYGNLKYFEFNENNISLNESKFYSQFDGLQNNENVEFECEINYAPSFLFIDSERAIDFILTNFMRNKISEENYVFFYNVVYKIIGFVQYEFDNDMFEIFINIINNEDNNDHHETNSTNLALIQECRKILREKSVIIFLKRIK